MSEYIKREDALDKFKRMPPSPTKEFIIETLNAIPAADVEPVVRSKWELHGGDDSLDCFWFCNNCGWNIEEESDANKWKRCPNCGAHMERSGSGELR